MYILISESKPQPPPKPQLPPSKEDTEKNQIKSEPNQSNSTNHVKMERAKSFVNVHKISTFQSNRIMPNDDLVLNQV